MEDINIDDLFEQEPVNLYKDLREDSVVEEGTTESFNNKEEKQEEKQEPKQKKRKVNKVVKSVDGLINAILIIAAVIIILIFGCKLLKWMSNDENRTPQTAVDGVFDMLER